MAYERGQSKNIIVGAAAMFVSTADQFDPKSQDLPDFAVGTRYEDTLSSASGVRNVGYTSNGLEISFQPDFGEVQVDQLLDVAKLYKQGMTVNLNTAFSEATLENLVVAIAASENDLSNQILMNNPTGDLEVGDTGYVAPSKAKVNALDVRSGNLGECPVERGLVAVGPGTGDCDTSDELQRVYVAYRALSMDNVTISAKRDEASMFEVSFRLLPAGNGSYGKIIDRRINTTGTF